MKLRLYADGVFSGKYHSAGYGVVCRGDLEYSYSEMVMGCVENQSIIEFIALCEAVVDLASRLKYKVRLAEVDLVVHSDNELVMAVMLGRKAYPEIVRNKYPYFERLRANFRSFTVTEVHAPVDIYMSEADRLGRVELGYMKGQNSVLLKCG